MCICVATYKSTTICLLNSALQNDHHLRNPTRHCNRRASANVAGTANIKLSLFLPPPHLSSSISSSLHGFFLSYGCNRTWTGVRTAEESPLCPLRCDHSMMLHVPRGSLSCLLAYLHRESIVCVMGSLHTFMYTLPA